MALREQHWAIHSGLQEQRGSLRAFATAQTPDGIPMDKAYDDLFKLGHRFVQASAGASRDVTTRTGIVLAQGGEFGFALLALAAGSGLMDTTSVQVVLAALIITMTLAPVSLRYSGVIAHPPGAGGNAPDRQELTHGPQGRRITASRPAEAARRGGPQD